MTADHLNNAALAMEDAGRIGQATQLYRQALVLSPDSPAALLNAGSLALRTGDVPEADRLLTRLVERWPDDKEALRALGLVRTAQGRTREAVEILTAAGPIAAKERCFYALHLPGDHDLHRAWASSFPAAKVPARLPERSRPIRVGYICPRCPTVYPFFLPVLAAHTDAVHVTCYLDGPGPAAQVAEISQHANWSHVARLNDSQLAECIELDEIDVLVALKPDRLGTLALRPAPLMHSWIGYPSWYGLPEVEPITDLWAYRPDPDAPAVQPLPADRNGFVTFGCVNRACKITAEMAALWRQILDSTPGARLVVLAEGGTRNRWVAELLGNDTRVTLAPTGSRRQYLELVASIDVALDTFPYNGTTTTVECLWSGVPVVTLTGEAIRSGVGARLLTAIGAAGTIAATPGQYVRIAAALAADSDRLRWVRQTLRPVMAESPLCDGQLVARALEAQWREKLGVA